MLAGLCNANPASFYYYSNNIAMKNCLFAIFFCFGSFFSTAQDRIKPLQYLSAGLGWTTYQPELIQGSIPAHEDNIESKTTFSLLFNYTRQLKQHSFLDVGLRAKMIQFFTRFNVPNSQYVDIHYTVDNIPAFDFTFSYAYQYTYGRFTLRPKAGLALFVSPFHMDTTSFFDFGKTESAHGYYKGLIQPGYSLGANVDFRLFRRVNIGADMNFTSAFSNKYFYYYRERVQYTHEGDVTYGMKMQNLHYGIHLGLQLGAGKPKKK